MSDGQSDDASVNSEYKETREVYDRLFQKYSIEHGIYHVPVDEEEEERLAIQHSILNKKFESRLFFVPVVRNPNKILDCGFGGGAWVLEAAEQYPDSQVTGIDIYPADLPEVPDNLNLQCADLNQHLTGSDDTNSYDIIQSRFVGPGIHKNRWPSYLQELAGLLKPGGGLQVLEYYYNFQSDNGSLNESHALYQWGDKYRRAMEEDRDPRIGTALRGGTRLVRLLERAGLVDIEHRSVPLPIGTWPSDPKEREIGELNFQNVDKMLDSFGFWPFIARLGMTKEEVIALNDKAREEASNPRLRPYLPLTVAWGRKP